MTKAELIAAIADAPDDTPIYILNPEAVDVRAGSFWKAPRAPLGLANDLWPLLTIAALLKT